MYAINYESLLKNKELPAYLRELISTLQTRGGTTVGTWIKNVSTVDLVSISTTSIASSILFSKARGEQKPGTLPSSVGESFILLTNVLSDAEGLDVSLDVSAVRVRAGLLDTYVSYELLKRKGFDVKIHYGNLSLNEDNEEPSSKLPVLEKGDTFMDQLLKATSDKLSSSLAEATAISLGKGVEAHVIDSKGKNQDAIRRDLEGRLGRKLTDEEASMLFIDASLWERIKAFGLDLIDWGSTRWARFRG